MLTGSSKRRQEYLLISDFDQTLSQQSIRLLERLPNNICDYPMALDERGGLCPACSDALGPARIYYCSCDERINKFLFTRKILSAVASLGREFWRLKTIGC